MALGAKCRHCKEPIAARYPLVESLGGLSFLAVTAGGLFGAYPLWALPVLYVFACVSIVIAFIDLDHHLILNVVLLPTLIATVLLLVVASFGIGEWNRLGRGALCALILFVFYFVLSLIWKGGMGDGDIKLAFILGLLLGWLGWPQFIIGSFAAFFIGGAISLVLLASKPPGRTIHTEPAVSDDASGNFRYRIADELSPGNIFRLSVTSSET